jgi:hypothetical protein
LINYFSWLTAITTLNKKSPAFSSASQSRVLVEIENGNARAHPRIHSIAALFSLGAQECCELSRKLLRKFSQEGLRDE